VFFFTSLEVYTNSIKSAPEMARNIELQRNVNARLLAATAVLSTIFRDSKKGISTTDARSVFEVQVSPSRAPEGVLEERE
jgi:hypothetical protein